MFFFLLLLLFLHLSLTLPHVRVWNGNENGVLGHLKQKIEQLKIECCVTGKHWARKVNINI